MLLLVSLAVSCGGEGGGKGPSGLLVLVPDGYEQVTRWDVARLFQGEGLEDLQEDFQDQWEWIEEYGIFPGDLDELVVATDGRGNTLMVFAGRFDFDDIRDDLANAGFSDSTNRDMEVWEQRRGTPMMALLEDRNQVVLSFPDDDGVKDLIKGMDRGSDFLFEDQDSELRRVLGKVGEGFHIMVEEECAGVDARGCKAVGYSARRGKDNFSVELQWAFLFRRESSARRGLDNVEDYFDDKCPGELTWRRWSSRENSWRCGRW